MVAAGAGSRGEPARRYTGLMFPALGKPALFEHLAAGQAAGVTVVTPNLRLARELAREFDRRQADAGRGVWETADILPLAAFVERLYEDALYSELGARLPRLLTPAQAQSLWESVIGGSRWGGALLALPQAAAEAARAWSLANAWRVSDALGGFPGNEDAKAFAEWARAYERRCAREGEVDAARLPDLVAPLLGEAALRKPKRLVAYGYDGLEPQTKDFLDACARVGIALQACAVAPRPGNARQRVFASARLELDAAAQWARACLEAGAQRIGVVVPRLGERRKEVARVFARTLDPAHNLPGAVKRPLPFNLSIGAPLGDTALARAAISVLELAAGEVPFELASRLLRSPFLAAAQTELAQRARLDAGLRASAPPRVTLGKLVGLVGHCPVLRQRLEALFALPRPQSASPQDWARYFTAALDAVGFPGERTLDSDEFQTRAKLNETLAEFARLERIAARMDLPRALESLRRLCDGTLFQPESPDAPVQVLGVIESLGLEFDALWVMGLTDEAWPLHTRANPFIPPALQRKAGIREASPEATLEWAKRATEGWLGAADAVTLSYPAREGDRELLPSPLIAGVAPAPQAPDEPGIARFRDLIFARRRIETSGDAAAPALAGRAPRGGARILADQSACPFRAFARYRLRAEALEAPAEEPDARTRGLLLHALMKALWSALGGSAGLERNVEPAIARAAQAAVAECGGELDDPLAALERERLAKLAREWLEVERARAPFEVVAIEERRTLRVAGLELSGRIDRMDRLADGAHALIDYKTGRPTPNDWMGERPNDPQLPLYALSAPEDVRAVAFAKLKTGEMRYMGFAEREDLIPELRPAQNWSALIEGWKAELEALGREFAAGDARVDPRKGLATCRSCDLQTLCRVYERVNTLEERGEDGGD
jgi:ATP-dependent helicase/nuclease subunit B